MSDNQESNIKTKGKRKNTKKHSKKQLKKDIIKDIEPNNTKKEYEPPAELIVKSILDKIINLSTRISFISKIEEKLPAFCFDFMKDTMLVPMLTQQYLTHYINPENTNKSSLTTQEPDNEKIFYSTGKIKENTWVEIIEPNNMNYDRFEGTYIKYNELPQHEHKKKRRTILNNIGGNENNGVDNKNTMKSEKESNVSELGNNLENSSHFKRDKSRFNTKKVVVSKISDGSPPEKELEKKEEEKEKEINSKKQRKNKMIDLPSFEIPGIEAEFVHEKFDPENVVKLRREREEYLIRKAKEERIRAFELRNQKKPAKEKSVEKVREKPFDRNKFTFDSNGTIISLRTLKVEGLISDFALLKNAVKNVKDINQNAPKSPRNRQKKIKKASLKIDFNNDPFSEDGKNKNNEKNNDKNERKGGSRRNTRRKSSIINIGRCQPSGSNFDIILPNIGVIIRENGRSKEGEGEFGKYFNKYSVEDYNKMLNETVPTQNRSMIQNKMGQSIFKPNFDTSSKSTIVNTNVKPSNMISTNNNSIDNIQNNSVEKSSKINSSEIDNYDYKSNTNKKFNGSTNLTNNAYSNLRNNSSTFGNSSANGYQSLIYNSTTALHSQPPVLVLKNNISSLKTELDNLQDLNAFPISSTDFPRTRSFLGRHFRPQKENKYEKNPNNYQNDNKYSSYDKNSKYTTSLKSKSKIDSGSNINLNDFNSKILANKQWGYDKGKNSNYVLNTNALGKHANRYQVLQELGLSTFSGIKVKLPRERKGIINL